MFRMDEEQLQALLERNPNLSVSQHSVAGAGAASLEDKEAVAPGGKNKYHNYPVFVYTDGFVFDSSLERLGRKEISQQNRAYSEIHGKAIEVYDSKKEYLRCLELRMMEKAGNITGLQRQYRLIIQPAVQYRDEHLNAITYCADFFYQKAGQTIVEDVKGYDRKTNTWLTTQVFNLKWKLLKAKYPDYVFQLF